MRKVFLHESLPAWISPSRAVYPQESRPRLHAEVDAWAIRATASNGFGGEPVPQFAADQRQVAQPLASAPHAARTGLRMVLVASVRRAVRRMQALLRLMQRRRRHAAEIRQLGELDAATLRDLGLHRSELGSIYAEAIGTASPTRRAFANREWLHVRAGVQTEFFSRAAF